MGRDEGLASFVVRFLFQVASLPSILNSKMLKLSRPGFVLGLVSRPGFLLGLPARNSGLWGLFTGLRSMGRDEGLASFVVRFLFQVMSLPSQRERGWGGE